MYEMHRCNVDGTSTVTTRCVTRGGGAGNNKYEGDARCTDLEALQSSHEEAPEAVVRDA